MLPIDYFARVEPMEPFSADDSSEDCGRKGERERGTKERTKKGGKKERKVTYLLPAILSQR